MRVVEKVLAVGIAALSAVAIGGACGGTVVFEEDGGGDGGDASGIVAATTADAVVSAGQGVTSAGPTTGGGGVTTGGATTGSATTGGAVTAGVTDGAATSVTVGGGACPSTNDGVCDEPAPCSPGQDAADCAFADAPCGPACAGDPGCAFGPPVPGDACRACVRDQAEAIASCAADGALGAICQSDEECADYVSCRLGGDLDCEDRYPEGFDLAWAQVFQKCGSCGDGFVD